MAYSKNFVTYPSTSIIATAISIIHLLHSILYYHCVKKKKKSEHVFPLIAFCDISLHPIYSVVQTRNLSNSLTGRTSLNLKCIKYCSLLSISITTTLVQAIIIALLDKTYTGAWCCPFPNCEKGIPNLSGNLFPSNPNFSTQRYKLLLSTNGMWHTYWHLFWGC